MAAKVIGFIPAKVLRERTRRQRPLKVSLGAALKKAVREKNHNPPRP